MPVPEITFDVDQNNTTAASGRGDVQPAPVEINLAPAFTAEDFEEPGRFTVERYEFPPGFDYGFGYDLYLD